MCIRDRSDVLGERDDSDSKNESVQWMKAAAERFEQHLQVMPEMVSGHALEHFIQFEEIERVLPMALDNYHARPAGESAVALVQALALAGQHPRAIALLEEILNTPYRSADLFATASILYRAQNSQELAQNHYLQAVEMNPMAVDDLSWLQDRVN